ncbi:VWA domain-containing protein [bacterium]|nr:VWA domain-containing protein [bacterium]MBU1073059.1 VWA domain-containing protein [bacterium]MBU1674418.1 VWA domain-containing protein [bacterium]
MNRKPSNRRGDRLHRILAIALASGLAMTMAGSAALARSLTPRAELDHGVILAGDENTVYVLIDFDVARFVPPPAYGRPDLNLAMVLDRSGSMADRGKMEYAREAAKIVVDRMHASDVLAVVEYDDEITVLWPAAPVEAKTLIKRRIDELEPRGSTNLCGGMMRGVEEAMRHRDGSDINRVILLSDGLANEGVTEPREIYRLVRDAKRRGVTISTMGLGLDYNEDLMQGIAENGGGNYYYIENPHQMSRIFGRELETLFTTVARDVVIRFRAGGKVSDVEVYGYPFEIDGDAVTIPLENFYSEEQRSLLLKLEIDPARAGDLDLGELGLTYHDYLTDEAVDMSLELRVDVSENEHEVERSRNDRVIVESTLTSTDKRQDEIVRLYEAGDMDAAQAELDRLTADVNEIQRGVASPRIAAKLEALSLEQEDMVLADGSAAGRSAFLKSNKARNYQGTRGKRGFFLMSEGDKGYEVERLQEALQDLGLFSGEIDGVYSTEVKEAVIEFQGRNNIKTDGLAGPNTLRALNLY